MKKKKFIAILIVLTMMIIPKVNAASTEYYWEAKNTEALQELIEEKQSEIQLVKNYIETNCITATNNSAGTWCPNDSNKDYLLAIQLNNIDSTFQVRLADYTSYVNGYTSNGISSYWVNNQYGTGGYFQWNQNINYQSFQIINGVVTPTNNGTNAGGSFGWSNIQTSSCNPTSENCVLDNSNWYFDTSYLKHDNKFYIKTNSCSGISGTCLYVPILLSNYENEIKVSGEYVSIEQLINNLNREPEIEPEENNCPIEEIATINAPNNFTTGGTITINKDTPITWQEIWFDTQLPVTSLGAIPNDYWEILSYKGGENRELYNYYYNFQCNVIQDTENIGNLYTYHCNLKYYFTTESEENIEATAIFVVKRNSSYNADILHNTIITATKCQNNETNIMTTTNNNVDDTNFDNWWNNVTTTLSNILNLLNPSNLIYLIVPTENQMQSLLNEMQESINNKLGILGLPLTIYTRFMNLANTETQQNWCINWDSIKVPNFEESEIIASGSWCFNSILENEKINNFRVFSINIIGGLILLAFIQYLNNTYHKVIESPDRDEYEYITTEDLYDVDRNTGELTNHRWLRKSTRREKIDK